MPRRPQGGAFVSGASVTWADILSEDASAVTIACTKAGGAPATSGDFFPLGTTQVSAGGGVWH